MPNPLLRKRVLVVEDDYFIASDLKQALLKVGADVVGPVGTVEGGLALADDRTLDAAVLDLNLAGLFSYPIADRLTRASIPHLFLTGYDDWAVAADYQSTPRLGKPFATAAVLDMLGSLCTKVVAP